MVYFVLHNDTSNIYIGKGSSAKRTRWTMKDYCPLPNNTFTLLGSFEGSNGDFQEICQLFGDLRSHGKWYRSDQKLLVFIEKMCNSS